MSTSAPQRWFDFHPWQTNAVLIVIGVAMIGFTRQLINESNFYYMGFDHVSGSQAFLYIAALLVYFVKPDNVNRYTLPIILTVAILCRLVATCIATHGMVWCSTPGTTRSAMSPMILRLKLCASRTPTCTRT